jgi:hypothetical protein
MCVWPIEGPLGEIKKSDDTFLATVLPIENLPLARVLTRFAIDPYKSTIEQAAVENK